MGQRHEWMLMVLPSLGDGQEPAPVTRAHFEGFWAHRGWEEHTPPPEVDVDNLAVKAVLAEVGDDPALAAAALAAEKDGQGRKTLIEALERIAAPTPPTDTEE